MRRVSVDTVIEEDVDRVLLGGVDLATDDRVTFHVKLSPHYARLLETVKAGRPVEVRIPI